MNIIGINAFHGDSSACLFQDGKMIAAAEEERFRRIKHWAGFPSEAIKYCLASRKLKLQDIDIIAINTDPKAARLKRAAYVLSGQASIELVKEKLTVRKKRKSIEEYLQLEFPDQTFQGKIEYVEHHEAHLASAFYVSPFKRAAVISVDGFGDFSSAVWGLGDGEKIEIKQRIYFPHSLGIFYQAMTQYLGFPHYGDEYKIMGLAPYGKPQYMQQMDEIVRHKPNGTFELNLNYFRHHKHPIGYEWNNGSPEVSRLYSEVLKELLGKPRTAKQSLAQKHNDIARSVQDAYERAFFHMLYAAYSEYGVDEIAVAGGCGMNSVANGKVHERTQFKKVYVQSAAGDAGGAIGAAIIAGKRNKISAQAFHMAHSYWGPNYTDAELKTAVEKNNTQFNKADCKIEFKQNPQTVCDVVTDALIDGKVVGWFQGAMEWGPRALGNRSILGDPRRQDMKDILNKKIKRRESFRPFAPSVLREQVSQWFESDADVPFMMKVFQIKKEKRKQIPAVTHVDGSGRLQTVSKKGNARYYELIKTFYKKTGVPMVLNTSFNENEPVVCQPQEAIDCFLRTNMDVLVLGSHVIQRAK